MEKNKLIFISMHLPSRKVPQAGQKIVMNKLAELSEKNEVFLVSLCNEMESQYLNLQDYSFCKEVHVFTITKRDRLKNIFCNLLLPFKVGMRSDSRVRFAIQKIMSDNDISVIHIEYEQGAVFIPANFAGQVSVVFHDVISQSISRFYESEKNFFKKIILKFNLKIMSAWERKVLSDIDNVIVLNEKDKKLISKLSGVADNIKVEYPQISESFHNARRDKREPNSFLFWGAMNRKENVDAVLWFYNEIYPSIVNEIPDAKFYIVGANPPDEIKNIASEKIMVTGFVDDPIPYFERCSVSVVPLRYGAGIKLKTLETMAAGLITVSTTVGAEGIEEDFFLKVEDSSDTFAKVVANTLRI